MDAAFMHRKRKVECEDSSRTPKEARKNELKAKTAVHKPTQIAADNIETCPTRDCS
jgi:hypothetical protein